MQTTRLKLIKTSKYFLTCQKCEFTYMAMTTYAAKHCPKCEPASQQVKYIDVDAEYLASEEQSEELVSYDNLYDGNIVYAELGL